MKNLPFATLLLSAIPAFAGPKFTFDDGNRSLEIQQAYQLWTTYTFDAHHTPDADDRADAYVRRARLTFKGQAWPSVDYQFGIAMDNMGKDSLSGTGGSPQIPATTTIQAIDALAWFHAFDDRIVVATGLMTPHLNREQYASFANVPALDQALTYSYVRDHYTTRNTGRETGLAVASVWYDTTLKAGIAADLGVYDNSWDRSGTSTTPTVSQKWAPLYTGRVAINVGDRENKGWKSSSDNSTRAKGWGLVLAGFGAMKGETETKTAKKDSAQDAATKKYKTTAWSWNGGSEGSTIFGGDVLLWAFGVTLQAEWAELGTSFSDSVVAAMGATFMSKDVADHVYGLRASWIVPWSPLGKFEPVVGWSKFEGDPSSPRYKGGDDEQLDAGLNWLLDGAKTKLSLHYLANDGSASTGFTSGPTKAGLYSQRSDSWTFGIQLQI